MSLFFDASEIFQFAIKIKENGEKFYRHAVQITRDNDTKEIFNYLANEESDHKKTFETLLSTMEKHEPFEAYPGEYFEYLRAYVDKIIFTNEVLDKEIPRIKDTLSAINYGIQRELDSILYYHEIKNFVPKHQHKLIDKIIDEERNHFSKLTGLRKNYE